ncbi:unnamed protein product [Orchesella dallaii]|uniref:Uncharacterized protein n=1 Tax=Orchesella dallaii TaxID=48710 RepID=A0ABP1S245_9HEXA
MRYSAELVLVIFGCAITLATARSINEGPLSRVVRATEDAEDPDGTPEAILANPESTKGFVAFGKNNFRAIQGIVDKHFDKKKEEGNQVQKLGVAAETLAQESEKKLKTEQYNALHKSFADFQSSRKAAMDSLLEDDAGADAGESGRSDAPAANPDFDSDEAAGAKAPAPAAAAPAAEAAPAADEAPAAEEEAAGGPDDDHME